MIAIFIILFFPARQNRQAFKGLESKGIGIAEMLAFNVSAAIEFEDSQAVQEAMASAEQVEEIAIIEIRRADGKLMGRFNRDSIDIKIEKKSLAQTETFVRDNMLHVVTPIISHQNSIGTLALCLSLHQLKAEVSKNRQITIVVSILILLLCIIVGNYLSSRLTAPLVKLSEAANKLSRGNLDIRVDVESSDEIGALA